MIRKTVVTLSLFFATAFILLSQARMDKTRGGDGLLHKPKYCLFYDNNTMKAIPDIGGNFDVEAFTDKI